MPTAVEYLANLLRNALKLDAIDSPYALRQFSGLDQNIDPGFGALNAAITPGAFAAAEHRYGRVFQTLGDGSVALGFDLQRDAAVLNGINQLLSGSDVFGGGGGSGEQADFGVLDRQLFAAGGHLEALGVDLVSFSQVSSHTAFVVVEDRFHPDLLRLADDFGQLSQEAATFAGDIKADVFGGGGGSGDQLRALYDAVSPFSDEFAEIGADFAKLADIYGGGGGSGTNLNGADVLAAAAAAASSRCTTIS